MAHRPGHPGWGSITPNPIMWDHDDFADTISGGAVNGTETHFHRTWLATAELAEQTLGLIGLGSGTFGYAVARSAGDVLDLPSADMISCVSGATVGATTGDWYGAAVRATDLDNLLYGFVRGDGQVRISKLVAGTGTLLANSAIGAVSAGDSTERQLHVFINGADVTVNYDGVDNVLTHTLSDADAATFGGIKGAGLVIRSTSALINYWQVNPV